MTSATHGGRRSGERGSTTLDARGLTIGYDKTDVVHDADLRLEPGRVTALIGPNGSGKSTLLRAIARLHGVRSGSVALFGGGGDESQAGSAGGAAAGGAVGGSNGPAGGAPRNVDALALSRTEFARRITLLAQSRPTPSGLSVRDVVGFGRHPHRGRFRSEDAGGAAAIEHAMRITGVSAFADRGVEQLSGGQLQRVWLASCLAQDTDVLLLDEPTTYLDLRYQIEMLDLVRELADDHGVTVGLVLHDLDQAAAIADRVVLLDSGRVVAEGTPLQVYEAERLTATYGIRIEIDQDAATGAVRTRAIGAHHHRHHRRDHHREGLNPQR